MARKRRYRSPVRERAAGQTRDLLRDTARVLFVEQGYVPTTMRQIAREAGVAERTLYLAFPTKAALLHELIGRAMEGDDHVGRVVDRPDFRIDGGRDGRRLIESYAAAVTQLYERAGALLMIGEQAAESDPALRETSDAGAAETLRYIGELTGALSRSGILRDGLTARRAADVAYVLSHFTTHHLLRTRRGWSRRSYQDWLTETLDDALRGRGHQPPV